MPAVVDILDHLRGFQVGFDQRCVKILVKARQCVGAELVECTNHRLWRRAEVLNRRPFAQKLRIATNSKINSCFLSRACLEDRYHNLAHGSGKNRTADNNDMSFRLLGNCRANLFADSPDIAQIQISVRLTGRSNAYKGKVGREDRIERAARGTEPAGLTRRADNLCDLRLDDGGLSAVDQVDLSRHGINAQDLMSVLRQTTGRDRTDISQTKNANLHRFGSPLRGFIASAP